MIDDRNIVKKYSLAEVVLFLIFAAGVLLGLLLVMARGRIDLSDPIVLGRSGVAAPVPVGPGWKSSESWSYQQPNQFVLSAELRTGSQLVAAVQYQYLLAAEGIEGEEFLKQTAAAARLRIARIGRITDGLEFDWVQLQAARGTPDAVIGVAELPQGRALVIHVRTPGDHLLATKLFRTLVAATVFVPEEQIARGAELVERMRAAGLTQLAADGDGLTGETVFYIRDAFDQPRGFTIMQFRRNAEAGDWRVLKGARVHYLAGTRGELSRSYLETDDTLEQYIWFTERSRMRRGRGGDSDIRLGEDGTMRISGGMQSDDFAVRPACTVPEMVLAQAARTYLDGSAEETVINVLSDRGQIVPAAVTVVDSAQDAEAAWGAVYCIRFEFLHAAGNETRFYFDADKRLVGRIDGAGPGLIWEPSDRRRLAEAFGDLDRYLGANGLTR